MFRARKPSVQRVSVGKHAPPDVPTIKPEPRAVVGNLKSDIPGALSAENVNANQSPGLVNNAKQPETTTLRPDLPLLPLPQVCNHHMTDTPNSITQPLTYDAEPDLQQWQRKAKYVPWHADDDDDEDLKREVREDRKISPEHDPLLAQMFSMFPDERPAE